MFLTLLYQLRSKSSESINFSDVRGELESKDLFKLKVTFNSKCLIDFAV